MARRGRLQFGANRGTIVGMLVATVIVGGSFAVASGADISVPSSYVAAVVAAFTGNPLVTVKTDSTSPTSPITTGGQRVIAVFNISVARVTHFATVGMVTIDVPITGAAAKTLNLTNFGANYQYCVPSGVTYGYGYKGGQCGSIPLKVTSASRSGNTYTITVYGSSKAWPLYPPQSAGRLTIYAMPKYAIGDSTTASVRAVVKSLYSSGDQCIGTQTDYKSCVPHAAQTVISGGSSWLKVTRTYGYGYCQI